MPAARYDVGFHGSEPEYCHVGLTDVRGVRKELFDVQLYDEKTMEQNGHSARVNSLMALQTLVETANGTLRLMEALADAGYPGRARFDPPLRPNEDEELEPGD